MTRHAPRADEWRSLTVPIRCIAERERIGARDRAVLPCRALLRVALARVLGEGDGPGVLRLQPAQVVASVAPPVVRHHALNRLRRRGTRADRKGLQGQPNRLDLPVRAPLEAAGDGHAREEVPCLDALPE